MNCLYLVAYDLPSTAAGNRRRQRLHDFLTGYGTRKQYSLFECFLNAKQFVKMEHKLKELIKPSEDSVCIYVLDAGAIKRAIAYGTEPPRQESARIL